VESQTEHHYLEWKGNRLHYLRFGHGAKIMLAFHGFSDDAGIFLSLAETLSDRYTVYAFDFPFHGKTIWNYRHPLILPLFYRIFDRFLEKNHITKFTPFGFSMGGRVAFSLVEHYPARIEALILAAPDGLQTHRVFNLAVYPAWGRFLFRQVMRRPGLFFFLLKKLYAWGRISKFLHDFTLNNMDTEEKRNRLYFTWITLRQFKPDMRHIKYLLNEHKIPVRLFLGQRDEVISPAAGKKFSEGLDNVQLYVVPKGHRLITQSLNPVLKQALKGL